MTHNYLHRGSLQVICKCNVISYYEIQHPQIVVSSESWIIPDRYSKTTVQNLLYQHLLTSYHTVNYQTREKLPPQRANASVPRSYRQLEENDHKLPIVSLTLFQCLCFMPLFMSRFTTLPPHLNFSFNQVNQTKKSK